jgi:phosphomannomutase
MISQEVSLLQQDINPKAHSFNDYFSVIKKMVSHRNSFSEKSNEFICWQDEIDKIYTLVADEIQNSQSQPVSQIKFGTSGWRGILGKDLTCKTVMQVAQAIVSVYESLKNNQDLADALGVSSLSEAQNRGCVIGHDNRFGGGLLAHSVTKILTSNGFVVHYAGESTTGCLSASVLELNAAFSVNLTPSHNPLEYGGFKFNAADGGPAAPIITDKITALTRRIVSKDIPLSVTPDIKLIHDINSLEHWKSLVRKNSTSHGLNYDLIMDMFAQNSNCVVAVDPLHGASRIHIRSLFHNIDSDRLILLRDTADPTFGGVAPEPSTENMKEVINALQKRPEPLKLGVVLDPDGDRIRFTDGTVQINMNSFGAMAYHYLHEGKGKTGMVAKTVATSNFANAIAHGFGEEIFEPKVGFKEFKPVIDKALVCFEESDGITVIGHTPEKDGYIGLILALDMMLNRKQNIGDYLNEIREEFGYYYPDKDGIVVSQQGQELKNTLAGLEKYETGGKIKVGSTEKTISQVIDIDGLKLIFQDNSWLMIRPSGTEPKVRFYVEARTEPEKNELFSAARILLEKIGLI